MHVCVWISDGVSVCVCALIIAIIKWQTITGARIVLLLCLLWHQLTMAVAFQVLLLLLLVVIAVVALLLLLLFVHGFNVIL